MPYDLKKALGTVSKSPQPFSIYEGPRGMTLLIPPNPKNITDAEAICGKGRTLVSGKCAKNDDNAVVLKTALPPLKKWSDGLKKAFTAAGCSTTHFEIEEEAENAPGAGEAEPGIESGAVPTGRARSDAVARGTPPSAAASPKPPTPVPTRGAVPTPPTPPPGRTTPPTPGRTPAAATPPTHTGQTGTSATTPQAPKAAAGATRPAPTARPEDPQLEVKVREHLALRKRLKTVLNGVIENYGAEATKLEERFAKAAEYTGQARSESPSNTLQITTFIDLVRDIVGEAEAILNPVVNDWKERTKEGSDMMRARVDHKTLPASWTPEQKAAYVSESNEAFGTYDKLGRQARKVVERMETKMEEITLTFEEAQSYSNQGQDPQVYVDRLTKLNKETKDMADYFKGKISAADGSLPPLQRLAEGGTIPKEQGEILPKKNDLAVELQNVINAKSERFDLIVKRVATIPADARSVPSVAAALKQFNEAAGKLKTDIASMKEKHAQVLAYLSQALGKVA